MSIETELFSWDGWDGDAECMVFYKPVLKVDIGRLKAGSSFAAATILNNKTGAVLQFDNFGKEDENGFAENIPVAAFKLSYLVGEEVSVS